MEEKEITKDTTQKEIICKSCKAKLTFAPGTNNLKCQYCGAENEIATSTEIIEELDFERFLAGYHEEATTQEVITVKCDACSAQTSFEANVVSDSCAFCGNPIVVSNGTVSHAIQPKSLLPFLIDKKKATESFVNWINKLWWAPNSLKKYAQQEGKLVGMYIPYWTYDADTQTSYIGERGDDFVRTEEYTEEENGETVTRTRTITETIWYPVSGQVENAFDDILVVASRSLPEQYISKLEPWDLNNLVPFNPSYLSGYKTESYQIDLKEGFEIAKEEIDSVIQESVLNDIGGNHQRVFSKKTSYDNITFKHLLLPIWISSYRYNQKTYRFLINGRTGQTQGERPYSWVKITLAILAVIAIIALIVMVG